MDCRLYALDDANGHQKWVFVAGAPTGTPALSEDGPLYVGSYDHKVYALDSATGQKEWQFQAGGSVSSSPAVGVNGTVYFGSLDNRVYALAGANGQLKWAFSTGGVICSSPALGADDTVYVGSADGRVYALDARTGTQKWVFTTGDAVWSSPTMGADGTVYVGSNDRTVYGLDAATGAMKWASVTGGWVTASPTLAADGTVYVGSHDGRFYALDGATGAQQWAVTIATAVLSSATLGADGTVYVGLADKLYALHGTAGLADSPWPKLHRDVRNTGRLTQPPRITAQPSRVVLQQGREGRLAVRVSGLPSPGLQWTFNGTPFPGATQATLTISSVTRADEGTYTVIASNRLGQVTSDPITAVVSNVEPLLFVGLKWESGNVGPVSLEATAQLGALAAWHSVSNYPSSSTTQLYVELDPGDTARFYRLNAPAALQFTAAGLLNGWWLTEPSGTRVRIEMVTAATGWTTWQQLTTLTLPASPYLFLDFESLGPPERVYRTSVVP